MKNYFLLLAILLSLASCEVDSSYDCYTFEVRTEVTFVPYRPMQVTYYDYDRYGLSYYMASQEARSNEYCYSYYSGGYYVTEYTTCNFWRSW